jgi:hypothetical protein
VIGDELSYSGLYTSLQDAEDVLARKVSPMFLSSEDWRTKTADKSSVVSLIAHAPKIFIFGSEKDLRQ